MTTWVLRLIVANVVMFLLSMAVPNLVNELMLVPAYLILRPWTLISYMFLHGGFGHIFFNMLALYFFGPRLEIELGSRRFLFLYFISGISGAVLSSILAPFDPIIGASAAIYGVSLGFAYFWPRAMVFVLFFPVEARWMVVGLTLLSLFGGFGGFEPGIAHFAHLGGFIGGYLYLKMIDRKDRARRIPTEAIAPPPTSADLERWRNIDRGRMHEVNREEYDRIMMKIQTSGVERLTPQERGFLDRFSAP